VSRRGFTAVELLVAAALLAALGTMAFHLASGARRQGRQVEELSQLQATAVLLRAALARDLDHALALRYLPEVDRPLDEDRDQVTLLLAESYAGDATPALRARRVEYRFADGQLRRDGRAIGPGGLTAVHFRWERTAVTTLRIELVADPTAMVGAADAPGRREVIRVPAPPGTDGAAAWRFSPRHETAQGGAA
jgi:prepilin-type N-terminal cleavage/methylation domain-containing protein